VWAFLDVETMVREFGPVFTSSLTNEHYEHVSGIIGAAGDIVEHEKGFRAQYAKVLAIFEDAHTTPKLEIAESYRCPIVSPDDYDAFCEERRLIRLG
jgi:hypothetical protein